MGDLPSEWHLPPVSSTNLERIDLSTLNKEDLIKSIIQLKKNRGMAKEMVKKSLEGQDKSLVHLLRVQDRLGRIKTERDHSYWGGQSEGTATIPAFLSPGIQKTIATLQPRVEVLSSDYDCLYTNLAEKKLAEPIPGPIAQQNILMQQYNDIEKDKKQMELEKIDQKKLMIRRKLATVRCEELDSQLNELMKMRNSHMADLWKLEDFVRYVNVTSRTYLCKKNLNEFRGDENEEIDDLEVVDDTDSPSGK